MVIYWVFWKSLFPEVLSRLEFSPHLFEIAKNRGLERAVVKQGDCREKNFWSSKVDVIITGRGLLSTS